MVAWASSLAAALKRAASSLRCRCRSDSSLIHLFRFVHFLSSLYQVHHDGVACHILCDGFGLTMSNPLQNHCIIGKAHLFQLSQQLAFLVVLWSRLFQNLLFFDVAHGFCLDFRIRLGSRLLFRTAWLSRRRSFLLLFAP